MSFEDYSLSIYFILTLSKAQWNQKAFKCKMFSKWSDRLVTAMPGQPNEEKHLKLKRISALLNPVDH